MTRLGAFGTLLSGMALLVQSPAVAAPDSLGVSTYPPRATVTGLKVGAISGAAAGTALMVLAGMFVDVMEEDTDEEFGAGGYVGFAVIGATLGAAAGGALGAHIGSLCYRGSFDRRRFPQKPPIGRLSLEAGAADFSERSRPDTGWWLKGTLSSHVTPWLATGPEVGFQVNRPGSHLRLAWAGRLEPWHGPVTPYLIGSIGPTFWSTEDVYLSTDYGAGIRLGGPGSERALHVEARSHHNIQNINEPGEPGRSRYQAVGAGVTWSW